MYLKDVLKFYELDNESKAMITEQSSKMRRGSAGVQFGKPATILDAACYVHKAWSMITEDTIRNSFIKANLRMNLSQAKPEELFSNEFVSLFNELNIQVTEEEVNQFIDVDTEGSSVFQVEILVEANSFFEESQPCVREEDHPSSEDESEDTTPQGPAVLSGVLEEHYKNSRKLQK